jgi:hypothetical protein
MSPRRGSVRKWSIEGQVTEGAALADCAYDWDMRLSIALALLVTAGCATGSIDELTGIASKDLSCPQAQIVLDSGGDNGDKQTASGCGRQASYSRSCSTGYLGSNGCKWDRERQPADPSLPGGPNGSDNWSPADPPR